MVNESEAPGSSTPKWPLDVKPLARTLAMFGVDYVVAGTFAAAPQRLLDSTAGEPLEVLVGGDEENLEAMADALFALQARPVGGPASGWRPWPATPGHVEGLVDTIAGRVRIHVMTRPTEQADTWEVEVGGEPVRLLMARQPHRLSDATRSRLAEQL